MPKERKKVLCMDAPRHAEYYGMQRTFDELYAKSKAGETFTGLMELVLSPDNIMLAYRNIKANTGSYPIAFIKYKTAIGISTVVCCFSPAGRKKIHDNLEIDATLFAYLREHPPEGHSLEYADCRLSLLSAQKGKCVVSGEWFLQPDSIVCHMKVPKEQGGQERYSNLVLLHRRYLPLLTDQDAAALKSICKQLTVTRKQLTKINNLRTAAKLAAI